MIKNFFKGIIIGIANVIPGVSGGTIAVVLGVFDQLIEAVNNFYRDFKKYIIFLAPIGCGAVIGILLFSKLVDYCLKNYTLQTNLFFIGLVCGSLPVIYKKAKSKGFKYIFLLPFIISIITVVAVGHLGNMDSTGNASEANIAFVFLGGVIASAAMVVPGISGSFVLVVLGLYQTVISAISNLDFIVLIPLGIGIIIGILLIAKIIDFLLSKYFSITYFSIFGLIIGSIIILLLENITTISQADLSTLLISLLTFTIGSLTAFKLTA